MAAMEELHFLHASVELNQCFKGQGSNGLYARPPFPDSKVFFCVLVRLMGCYLFAVLLGN